MLIEKTSVENEIGEQINEWKEVVTFHGVLGLQDGESKRTYNTKIEESTHVLVCDYSADIYLRRSGCQMHYKRQNVRCNVDR